MSIEPSVVRKMDADELDLKKPVASGAADAAGEGAVPLRDHTWLDGYLWDTLAPNCFHDFTNPESLGYVFDSGQSLYAMLHHVTSYPGHSCVHCGVYGVLLGIFLGPTPLHLSNSS